jgi:acetyltransferase
MKSADIRSAVQAVIASIAPEADPAGLRPDRPLREQVDLDSMDWLNVVAGLHERLGIEIPEADYGKLATVDAMVAYLQSRRRKRPRRPRAALLAAGKELPATTHTVRGTTVVVRPMRPDDRDREAEFVRHLSDEARYKRFMASVRELSERKLRYLTEVDQLTHVALVATTEREGMQVEIGVARYVVEPAGRSCEFAIVVDDEWQGSGLAGIMMQALIAIARARGLATMVGIVLANNAHMLRFTRQLGFRAERDPDDLQTLRVVLALQAPVSAAATPSPPR